MWNRRSTQKHTKLQRIILDHTRQYNTIHEHDHTRKRRTIQDHTLPNRTVQGPTIPLRTLKDHTKRYKPCRAIQEPTNSYIQDRARPHKAVHYQA